MAAINNMIIGNHLRAARKRAGLTQADVANKINLSLSYYSQLERGKVRINLERLFDLCILFEVTPEQILAHACLECERNLLPQSVEAARQEQLVAMCTAPAPVWDALCKTFDVLTDLYHQQG